MTTSSLSSRFVWRERYALYFALLVAWVAMLGSLYFSEVRHYTPCLWCWYQRILMYPIALVLPIGLLRRDEQLPFYTAAFSGLGICASTYHYLLQKTTWFAGTSCLTGVPCNMDYINWLGFITIPFLALIAFVLIFFSSIIVLTSGMVVWEEEERAPWQPVAAIVAAVVLLFAPSFLTAEPVSATPVAPSDEIAALLAAPTPSNPDAARGRELFQDACAACHGSVGEGKSNLGPALVGTDFTANSSAEAWLDMVREGREANHPDNQTGLPMPPSGGRPDLTDADLQAILSFLRGATQP